MGTAKNILSKSVTIPLRGKEFEINFCPLRLDIMWNSLVKVSKTAIELSANYIRISQDVKNKDLDIEQGKKQAKELEEKLKDVDLPNQINLLLDAVEVALKANEIEYDRDWWTDNVSLDEITLFLTAVTEKDLKKKKQIAKLLAYVQ